MYQRAKKWIFAVQPSAHNESVWENTFTIEEDGVVDIRFSLEGYGWKENANQENLVSLEKGSYKVYYRINGQPDWTFLSRIESNRAGGSESIVYKSVGCTTGLLTASKYDVKIVADKGAKFTGWGGTLEGIASGGQFWSNLQVRVRPYHIPSVYDEATVEEDVGVQIV